MKKIIIGIILICFIIAGFLLFTKKEETDLTKVKVAEVAHTVFYAPQYVAHGLGFFKEEGLDVELILTPGADKVTAAVLSNDVNIGFCGSEATIYVYNEGEKDYLINFAGVTKRDGTFLVSRKKMNNFKFSNLKGSTIIGGRAGGMPEMTLEWILKENGLNVKKDLTINTSIDFAAMGGAFIGGTGDYVTLFEPSAFQIEKQGLGYVVASIGKNGGEVPYTVYNARKSYIDKNPEIIKSFEKAIQKGLDYVKNEKSEKIAEAITGYFPDLSMNELIEIVKRYKENDSWYTTTKITEDQFNKVQDIMSSAGYLNKRAPYKKLVNNG